MRSQQQPQDDIMQNSFDSVINYIERALSGSLEESAKIYGALIRKRGVASASGLLRGLLIYASSAISIRMLSLCAFALKIADVSDTAWRKRIVASAAWLVFLLNSVLPKPPPQEELSAKKLNVRLIDASDVKAQGDNGMVYRIHMSYNLSAGCMDEIKVTDHHTAESFAHFTIEKDAIYIADAGYGKAKLFSHLVSRQAHAILRITPNLVRFVDQDGQLIEMVNKLDTAKKTMEFNCYMQDGKKAIPVRIIASQLPEDKKPDAIRRKMKKAQKDQRKCKPETLVYAQWVILATSLEEDRFTAEEILAIYRCRWQIELLFKRIKQHFKVTRIRASSEKHAQAVIALWLLIWAIAEHQIVQAERYLFQKEMDMERYSIWTMSSFFFHRVKMMIDSAWATLLDPLLDLEALFHHLKNHKDGRRNQYFDFRRAFSLDA